MLRFLKKIFLYGFVTVLILNFLAMASFYSLKRSNFYKPLFAKNIANEKKFDYVLLGSSMGLTTLNTKLIDSITGFKSVNLSMDDTALPTHFLMLKHFLKQGGKTKNVVLTVSPWDIANDKYKIGNNDYRFLPFIQISYVSDHFDTIKNDLIHPIPTSKYFPLYGFGYYNSEIFYPSLISLFKPRYRNRFDERGNYVYPTSKFNSKEYAINSYDFKIKNRYLFKLKELCKNNKINLIIYQSPIFKTYYKNLSNEENFINHIDLLNSHPEMFYDRIHVNAKGRKYVTLKFIEEIIVKK